MTRRGIGAAALALAVAGCVESEEPAVGGGQDGLSGSEAQFESMTRPCLSQAARLTGVARDAITVTDRIRTGGGPILTLSAAGTPYTCRSEKDGSVTVFSEFAG